MNKIYIVVPVFNVEAYLERCLNSILAQTYTNYELILVDDGSTDQSGIICDEYKKQHAHIFVIHQKNQGISAARNAGIDYVIGLSDENAWITFIDSDDYIHPQYLEYLNYAAENGNTNISCCYYDRINQPVDLKNNDSFEYEKLSPEELWVRRRINAVVAWGKLYRISLFQSIRYPVGKIHEDDYITYKLLFKEKKISYISVPLYFWWVNLNSITTKSWKPARLDQLDAIDEQVEYFKNNGYHRAYRESYKALCENCIFSLRSVEALNPKYKELKKPLRKRLIRYLKDYGKNIGYNKAISLWFTCRIKKPVSRVLKNESLFSFMKRKILKKIKIS